MHLAPDTAAAEASATPTLSSLNAPKNLFVPDMPPSSLTVSAINVASPHSVVPSDFSASIPLSVSNNHLLLSDQPSDPECPPVSVPQNSQK